VIFNRCWGFFLLARKSIRNSNIGLTPTKFRQVKFVSPLHENGDGENPFGIAKRTWGKAAFAILAIINEKPSRRKMEINFIITIFAFIA
jgi:hypothetical protein